MKPIALVAAGLLLGAPAMALETGVRHSHGHSWTNYSGRSTTRSRETFTGGARSNFTESSTFSR